MKRLVVVLALTNVLTLLGLAVCATVLVVNSARSTLDEVQGTSDREMQGRFAELEARYLAAKEREDFWRDRLRENDHEPSGSRYQQRQPPWQPAPAAPREQVNAANAASPVAPPVAEPEQPVAPVAPPADEPRAIHHDPTPPPKPTGVSAWRLISVDYNAEFPERSKAVIEIPGDNGIPRYQGVRLRDTVNGWTVKMLEPTRLIVEDNLNHQRVIDREHSIALAPDGSVQYEQIGPMDPRAFDGAVDRHAEGEFPDREPQDPQPAAEAQPTAESEFSDGTVMTTPEGTQAPDVDGVVRPASDAERAAIEASDRAEGDEVDLPAGVAARTLRHLLTAEQMYSIKQDWRRVLMQGLFESHFNPDGDFDGVRLVSFPKNSIYSLYGFQLDDVIQAVNGHPVHTGSDVDDLPYKADFTNGATIQVLRDELVIVYRFIADPRTLAAHEEKLAREDAARRELLDAARDNGYPQPIPQPDGGDTDDE